MRLNPDYVPFKTFSTLDMVFFHKKRIATALFGCVLKGRCLATEGLDDRRENTTLVGMHTCIYLGTIPILGQNIFGLFGPHPPYQLKYITERLQKWSFSKPTHSFC